MSYEKRSKQIRMQNRVLIIIILFMNGIIDS